MLIETDGSLTPAGAELLEFVPEGPRYAHALLRLRLVQADIARLQHKVARLTALNAKLSADHGEMTRRDAFAAAAMQALIGRMDDNHASDVDLVAQAAWAIADDMIVKREAGR